jgi:hypothetical protein
VIIQISESKGSPKRKKRKKLGTQINGKCNDTSSTDENKYKNISVEPSFINCAKR